MRKPPSDEIDYTIRVTYPRTEELISLITSRLDNATETGTVLGYDCHQ